MDLKLLTKYVAGECYPEERKYVEHWLQSDPLNKEFLNSIDKIWEVDLESKFQTDVEKAWAKFRNEVINERKIKRVGSSENVVKYRAQSNKKPDIRHVYIKVAAVAAVMLMAFLLIIQTYTEEVEGPSMKQLTMQEIVTQKGEKTRLKLSDGTKVILNSASQLIIPSQFTGNSREVFLTGEAMFEVSHKEGQPFIVRSANTFTQVLGTRFVVSAYPDVTDVKVAVEEGEVLVGLKDRKIDKDALLVKGQVGVVKENEAPTVTDINNIHAYIGWTKGQLVFDNMPLYEIKPRLERWYDISITIHDQVLNKRKFTAVFDNEPLSEVLQLMALSMDMKYEKEKDKVSFFDDKD